MFNCCKQLVCQDAVPARTSCTVDTPTSLQTPHQSLQPLLEGCVAVACWPSAASGRCPRLAFPSPASWGPLAASSALLCRATLLQRATPCSHWAAAWQPALACAPPLVRRCRGCQAQTRPLGYLCCALMGAPCCWGHWLPSRSRMGLTADVWEQRLTGVGAMLCCIA